MSESISQDGNQSTRGRASAISARQEGSSPVHNTRYSRDGFFDAMMDRIMNTVIRQYFECMETFKGNVLHFEQ